MSAHYVIIRVDDQASVQELVETIIREYKARRSCPVKQMSGEVLYYEMETIQWSMDNTELLYIGETLFDEEE